jgi:L-ascorbate metabolism protein UlaG (beta-lactamase superfamily)
VARGGVGGVGLGMSMLSRIRLKRRRLLKWLGGTALGGGVLVVGRDEWLSAGPGWKGPVSDHFDGRVFFNPWGVSKKSGVDLWKWRFTRKPVAWPGEAGGLEEPALGAVVGSGGAAVTLVGHATWLIRIGGMAILTDPVWSERCSPVSWAGPKRVRRPAIGFESLPKIDVVLLSHNHYDHLDVGTLRRVVDRWSPWVVTGLGNRAFLEERGMPGAVELDWWERRELGGVGVTFTPAQHWSNRGGHGLNATLWGGFVVEAGGVRVYFAGDTGYAPFFGTIRERCGAPDLALLPIGAYEPRWFMATMHMNPEEAVRAHGELGAKRSLGMHYGTWQLTDEGMEQPVTDLALARAAVGLSEEGFGAGVFGRTVVV